MLSTQRRATRASPTVCCLVILLGITQKRLGANSAMVFALSHLSLQNNVEVGSWPHGGRRLWVQQCCLHNYAYMARSQAYRFKLATTLSARVRAKVLFGQARKEGLRHMQCAFIRLQHSWDQFKRKQVRNWNGLFNVLFVCMCVQFENRTIQ